MIREILETIKLNEKFSQKEDSMIHFIFNRIGNGDVKFKRDGDNITMKFSGIYEAGIESDLDNMEKTFPKQKEFKDYSLVRNDKLSITITKNK